MVINVSSWAGNKYITGYTKNVWEKSLGLSI